MLSFILGLYLVLGGFYAQAYNYPGAPGGFVNDYANVLTAEQLSALEEKLGTFARESGNELAIAIITSLEGDTIENFARRLFEDWGIGGAKNDNGVLLLVAFNDRQMRLETGYGLEGALPDALAYQIMDSTLKPAFKEENYYGGLWQASEAIMAATRGEYEAPALISQSRQNFQPEAFLWLFIFGIYGLSALWRWLAKSKSWWQGGVLGAVVGLIMAWFFFQAWWWLSIVLMSGFGLLVDFLASRVLPQPRPRSKGKDSFWWLGPGGGFGGGRPGGGFGGGFGGFGGGRSGGGGVSGRW